jgi:hypothetical protein
MCRVWRRAQPQAPLEDLSILRLSRLYRRIDVGYSEDEADSAARAELLERVITEWLRRRPQDDGMYFDRGLYAKWRRDWPAAQTASGRALDLLPAHRRAGEPAAWNLGIAATARRDWATARRAWTAFGISVQGTGDVPVSEDLGPAPVRLNPSPRHIGQQAVEIDGRTWDTEVVWGSRLDPARVRIVSVPMPGSGHRHGDVVLHDGDPRGTRRLDDQELGVFDEIELWERSTVPTLGVVVTAPSATAVEELVDDLAARGMAGENWTTSVRMLCRACSEGSPGDHDHPGGAVAEGRWTVGMSGTPDDAAAVLSAWSGSGPGRGAGELTVELA